ncbi:DNA-binding transcriptional regulator YhcF (GntR family) [Streptomyces sp. V4I23]|nr:DNA-binding transcriptional regulator YhcF (GntR family) [Streptomyces sp. V4I23]
MSEIQRPGALYQQVAAAIREAILSGEFAPDSLLPSESQLMARYGVSRPTVRNAIAALRAEGLIDVRHGKGSFVRSDGQPTLTLERRISRTTDGRFGMPNGDAWDEAEEPSTYRTHTTKATGPLLGLGEEEAVFGCDRLLIDKATGARAMHRTLIPFEVAEAVPLLAEEPCKRPAAIYAGRPTPQHTRGGKASSGRRGQGCGGLGVDGLRDFRQLPWGEPRRTGGRPGHCGQANSQPGSRVSVRPPVLSPHGSYCPKSLRPATCPRAALTSEKALHAAPPSASARASRSTASRSTAPGHPARRTTPRPLSSVEATARTADSSNPAPSSARFSRSAASRASRQPAT